jgi:hypothetical protein
MKSSNIVLLLLALWLAPLSLLTAQERFSIGPRVGVQFANLVGDGVNKDAVKASTRLVAGLTSTYSINEATGLTIDLLYSGEGQEAENGESKLDLSYLRLPILFDFFLRNLGEGFRPKFYAGLSPGLLLGAEVGDLDVKEFYNDIDVAGVLGLGFNARLVSTIWLNTDFRYQRGFLDVFDEDTGNDDLNVYNQNWHVSLGIAFGL